MMNGNGYGMNGWGWAGMTLMAVLTIAIVGLVVWAVTSDRRSRSRDLLNGRLASGEVSAEEYRERLEAGSARR
jgi:uncharacterized membrane protein